MLDLYGLHVLLVEDQPDERWLLGEILRSRGHTVTACEDGKSGWITYQKTHPPLVVMDWTLPGMDGQELCRRIREEEGGPGCVIMVVTSRDSAEDLRTVLEAGVDDYIPKPVNVPLLEIRLAVAEQRVKSMREKERTRIALEAKTRELEALFQNLDEVFFSIDLTSEEVIQVSPAAQKLLGVSPVALMRDRLAWRELLLPPELSGMEDLTESVPASKNLTFEYQVTRPDGLIRWVKSNLKLGASPEGEMVRLDGILSDLTARKVAEEELSARNRELSTLFRVSEITLTASDPSGAFREVLGEVCRATGFAVAFLERMDGPRDRLVIIESVGLTLPEKGPPAIPVDESLSAIAIEHRKPLTVEDAGSHPRLKNEFLRRQDLRSYVAFPLLASGKVHGVLTLADTRAREVPLRLLRWGESLANTLALYVERIEAEAALKEGERKALSLAAELQTANKELEAFTYSVSHDLRAPLRTMQGFAHTLLSEHGTALPPQAVDFVDRIVDSGRQSEALIRDLLAYSRMSFEDLELREVALEAAFEEAREQVAADVSERGAAVNLPESFPKVLGHHGTLVQVLANLLANAIKFVPDGRRPEVSVLWEERAAHRKIRLWIEDNGVGIPEEHQERIFDTFQRLEGEVQRPGTGIGLAIVRRGVQRLGGEVGLISRVGEGSRFWVDLQKGRPQGWHPWGRTAES